MCPNANANATANKNCPTASPHNQQCNEYFHSSHPWTNTKNIRACQSKLHKHHNVCTDCHNRAHTLLTDREKHVEKHVVGARLCSECSVDVVETFGKGYQSCSCPFGKSEDEGLGNGWFCFECRQTRLWSAGLVGGEWYSYSHGETEFNKRQETRFLGVAKVGRELCPKCRKCFCAGEGDVIVKACLVCEGVCDSSVDREKSKSKGRRSSSNDESRSGRKERRSDEVGGGIPRPAEANGVAFTLPDWTGQITGRRRPALDPDEHLAPDELPWISNESNGVPQTNGYSPDLNVSAQVDQLTLEGQVDPDEDLAPDELPRISNESKEPPQAKSCSPDGNIPAQLDQLPSESQDPLPTPPHPQNNPTNKPPQSNSPRTHHPSTPPSSPHPLTLLPQEWSFPRNPAKTPYNTSYQPIGPTPQTLTLEELLLIKHKAVRMREACFGSERCWNCGCAGHSWTECKRPDNMEELDRDFEGARRKMEREGGNGKERRGKERCGKERSGKEGSGRGLCCLELLVRRL